MESHKIIQVDEKVPFNLLIPLSIQHMFAMIMLVDISHCSVSHEELHNRTDALAKEMGMQINVTRQEVFDAMHTI